MSDDLVERYRQAQEMLGHGCSDGHCVIEKTNGQHTNGGCKCLYQPDFYTLQRVGYMLTISQRMADRIEELTNCVAVLEAKLEKAVEAGVDVAASLNAAISLLERGGKKAAPSDKMFNQMLADYNLSLDRFRTTLAAVAESHKLKSENT